MTLRHREHSAGRTFLLLAAGLGLVSLAVASSAAAQDGFDLSADPAVGVVDPGPAPNGERLPLVRAQRPLTLTRFTARGDADLTLTKFPDIETAIGSVSRDTVTTLPIGGAFGITSDLEAGATVLPMLLSPDFDYGDPSLYGRYRLLPGDTEVAGEFQIIIPVNSDDLAIRPAVPVRFHLGPVARLDVEGALRITFADDTIVTLEVPADFSYNVSPNIFVGGASGFSVFDMDFDFLTIPLTAYAGYTLPADSGGPLLDVAINFGWPFLLTPGSDGDTVNFDTWQIGAWGRVYFEVEG